MYTVLVAILPILIVTLIVVVAYITTVAVIVTVLVALFVVGRPLFAVYPGAVPLPAVRTTAIVFFVAAFAIFVALLIGGTVFLIGR